MHLQTDAPLFTRRRLLAWTAGATVLCGRIYGFAADFWNKKGPADWSSDEVHVLLTKSPWAKQVTAETSHGTTKGGSSGANNSGMGNGGMGNGGMGTGGNGRSGAGGLGGSGGRGGMGGGGGMGNAGGMGTGGGGGGTPRAVQQVKGIVRWESAKPVLEAAKETLPDVFPNHYVIGVINFPLGGRRPDGDDSGQPKVSKAALERFKAATSLTPKGKDPVQPAVAQVVGTGLYLGFSKESLQLSPDDKEVAFATVVGRMSIKTKFIFKEMMYHETLAI